MDRFNKIIKLIKNKKIKIKFKNKSLLMKIISKILFFNKKFMTNYTTTIGNTIYFPSRDFLYNDNIFSEEILLHELVHINDNKKDLLFPIKYLFPQILFPLSFFLLFLNIWIFLPVAILLLLPLPAIFRKNYELRGYTASLIAANEIWKEKNVPLDMREKNLHIIAQHINTIFTGPQYYYMWRFGVRKELNLIIDKILNESIVKTDPSYEEIVQLIKGSR
jgi:hypothetical protein